jgi:hypothetical protein
MSIEYNPCQHCKTDKYGNCLCDYGVICQYMPNFKGGRHNDRNREEIKKK